MYVIEARIEEASYGSSGPVLRDLELRVPRGEAVLVLGRSGSGKTTLLRAVVGILEEMGGSLRGRITLRGRAYLVPQEPWDGVLGYTPSLDVAFSLSAAGRDPSDWGRYLAAVGLEDLGQRPCHLLSAGETRRLNVASSTAFAPDALLLDETSAFLDEDGRRALLDTVEDFLSSGGAALIVDHDERTWRGIASEVLVLVGMWPRDSRPSPRWTGLEKGEVVAEVRDLWFRYPGSGWLLRGLSFEVSRGEVVAVVGPNGSGKTTLLRILLGALRPTRGEARAGRALLIPEDPILFLGGSRTDEEADPGLLREFDLPPGRPSRTLSSGERRRLAIAAAVGEGADLLLLDEPTAGLDPWSRAKVLEALGRARERAGIVVATHDSGLASMADRVIVLGG